MDGRPQTDLKHYGHLGIISSIFKAYGTRKRIHELLPKTSNKHKVNHSDTIQCMTYQGLGFGEKRMYVVSDFFSDEPTSHY